MSEIKTHYNINNLDSREINFVLNQIANRLDALEGLRGTPRFYHDIDAGANKIVNTVTGTLDSEVLTYPATIEDFADANHDHENTAGGGQLDHGDSLGGLADDDHSGYLWLTGRSGGQNIVDDITIGDITTGNYLTIISGTITIYSGGYIVHKIEGG